MVTSMSHETLRVDKPVEKKKQEAKFLTLVCLSSASVGRLSRLLGLAVLAVAALTAAGRATALLITSTVDAVVAALA